jgi:tetratricopeptide (TPR) repeat protein
VDETGRVYVTDYHYYAIAEYTSDGRFLQDHLLAKERLIQPTRMAVSRQALYVVNEGKGEILQFAIRSATTGLEHAILGEELLALREYTKAVMELSQALNLGYATAETHYLLGLAFSALDQLREAIQQLKTAATKAPTFVEAFVQLGHGLARAGDLTAAVTVSTGFNAEPEARRSAPQLGRSVSSRE